MKFRELLAKTQFIKKYTNRRPKIDLITEAIMVANEGPLAGNLQPFQYVIVEDPESIAVLAQACQQSFIAKAPYVIVVTSDITQTKKLYGNKAEKYLKQNVGAAIQNFTLQLAESGISSSLVASFSDVTIHNKLKIPNDNEIEMVITVGEGLDKSMHRRKPILMNKIFFDTWKNKWHKPAREVSRKDI